MPTACADDLDPDRVGVRGDAPRDDVARARRGSADRIAGGAVDVHANGVGQVVGPGAVDVHPDGIADDQVARDGAEDLDARLAVGRDHVARARRCVGAGDRVAGDVADLIELGIDEIDAVLDVRERSGAVAPHTDIIAVDEVARTRLGGRLESANRGEDLDAVLGVAGDNVVDPG